MLEHHKTQRPLLLKAVSDLYSLFSSNILTLTEPMQDMSEDEDDNGDEPAFKIDEEKNDAARKAREDRQEKLRQMMEGDGKLHCDTCLM